MSWTQYFEMAVVLSLLGWLMRQIRSTDSGRWIVVGRYLIGGFLTGLLAADHLWRLWPSHMERAYGLIGLPILGAAWTRVTGHGCRPKDATPRNPEYLRLERRAWIQYGIASVAGVFVGAPLIRGRWTATVLLVAVFVAAVLYVLPNILRADESDDGPGLWFIVGKLFQRWQSKADRRRQTT